MTAKSVRDIELIVQKALDLDTPVSSDSSAENISQWDSLGQINIIVALDEALHGGVSDIPEIAAANSMSKLVEILRRAGKLSD